MVGSSRVEIDPVSLTRVAGELDAVGRIVAASGQHLRRSANTIRLNPADPFLDPGSVRSRVAAVERELAGAGRGLLSEGELCRSTAVQAQAADSGGVVAAVGFGGRTRQWLAGGLICRVPDHVRRPIDRVLTDVVGDGIEWIVKAGIRLIDGVEIGDTHANVVKTSGDRDGTFSTRPLTIDHLDEPNVVSQALTAIDDRELLAHDEFGIIDHGGGRFTVVLPGVTDLTAPNAGLHPVHRSVRDLDATAIESARVSGVAGNRYARMVAEALGRNGVTDGARLTVVGHSFGADTALDLAADPEFVERYELTQVVATGHHSRPQLNRVIPSVNVLVLRNTKDLVVAATTLLPTEEAGVLGCRDDRRRQGGAVVVVDVGGRSWPGLGHDVSLYQGIVRADAETEPGAHPDSETGAAAEVRTVLDRLDAAGFGTAATMSAVDVSVPSASGRRSSGLG